MERHSFRIISGDLPEAMSKLYLCTNFPHQKLGEITVFHAVGANRKIQAQALTKKSTLSQNNGIK